MFTGFIIFLLVIMCLLFGALYEFSGAALLVAASSILIFFHKKAKRMKINVSTGLILALLLTLGYLVSSLYAIDRGMAFLGFIKILWILPAILCYSYLSDDDKNKVFDFLPWLGCMMVVTGCIAYFIPPLRDYFFTAGRFGGVFNYPNTQAIFLLLCIVWMCNKTELSVKDLIRYVILLLGIGLTGSRMVFVFTVMTVIYLMICKRNRFFILLSAAVGICLLAIVLMGANIGSLSRFTTISLTESTFVGRLLYAYDAVPLLLKYPLGTGYLGFYYLQNSIQSGWYSVQFVHNDLLQIGLDIGVLPMVLYLLLILRTLFGRQLSSTKKIILFLLFAHGLFDFDLAFGSILFIMLMILDDISWKTFDLSLKPLYSIVPSSIAIFIGLYFAVPLGAERINNHGLANQLYPLYTEAKLSLLSETDDSDVANQLADEILAQNQTCALAYYAKAMVADINEDYEEMVRYAKEAIRHDYFNIDEYSNFTLLLYDGLLYGDTEDYLLCAKEMSNMESYMKEAMGKLSPLGKKIKDQPELQLTEDMLQILDAM